MNRPIPPAFLCPRRRGASFPVGVSLVLLVCVLGVRAQDADKPKAEPAPTGTLSAASLARRAAWQQHLTLGAGDVVSLSLFGSPDTAKTDVPIAPDGRISFLQAQDVMVAGLTVDELRAKLDKELEKYYRNPRTVITPVAFRSKKYYLLGKVVTKGAFVLDRPMTVVEAVAQARGFDVGFFSGNAVEIADLQHSFLVREGKRVPVDFEKLFQQGDLAQNIPVEPGDYLYFPSANENEVYLFGEVAAPGPNSLGPKATLIGAVTAKGGFTPRGYLKKILVVRGSLNQPETFVVNAAAILAGKEPDFQLKPKDIIYVSERPWSRVEDLLDLAISSFMRSMVVTWTSENLYPPSTR